MDDTDRSDQHELMDSLRRLDQKALYEKSFTYIRSKTNQQTVTIEQVMSCFLSDDTNQDEKFHLGWTALSMFYDRKESLKQKGVSEETFKEIIACIVEKMV
tara:strand:+ start:6622 stop:6924 length:303 start_codon:yes stop_codon:yes gene_type:complete